MNPHILIMAAAVLGFFVVLGADQAAVLLLGWLFFALAGIGYGIHKARAYTEG